MKNFQMKVFMDMLEQVMKKEQAWEIAKEEFSKYVKLIGDLMNHVSLESDGLNRTPSTGNLANLDIKDGLNSGKSEIKS